MRRHPVVALSAVIGLLLLPEALAAQSPAPPQPALSEILPRLYESVINGEVDALDGFSSDVLRARIDAASQINNRLASQLSSFPLVSSAGGFTWRFAPVSGTFTRASDSFGPIFADRALTIGRNRANFGVNFQRVTFDRLEGKALRDGEILGYSGIPVYLSDRNDFGVFFQDALSLQASATTVSVFATYGASDRFDIGLAVPINQVSIRASLTSVYGNSIDGVAPVTSVPGCNPPPLPTECTPVPETIVGQSSGTAVGLGDVVVRAKYNFLPAPGGGLAGAVDLRLPTGDERNLLGSGGAQAKMYLIASTTANRVSPHVNVGYTVSGESDAARDPRSSVIAPPNEINYAGGGDIVVSLRTTATLDVVGRRLLKAGALVEGPTRFLKGTSGARYQELQLTPGVDVNLLLGSVGVRMNPVANMLVAVNVLFPLTQRGLTDRLTWLVGADYSF